MRKALWLALVLVVLVAAGYSYMRFAAGRPAPAAAGEASSTPSGTQTYTNSVYGFSLMMPADYTATETQDPDTNADVIVLQNNAGDGIQIMVTPFDEDTGTGYTLTADRIHKDQPDLVITDAQPVVVGPNYTGLAFLSNNDAFGGQSRAVWFVYKGNLYQINTYARLDPVLQAIFATWKFQ